MKASAASANDCAISRLCVTSSSWRLSERSAIAPAHADSSRIGPNWQAASRPTATPLPVRCEDEQRERDHRQPVAGVGDRLADEEQPEVADPQRGKRPTRPARRERLDIGCDFEIRDFDHSGGLDDDRRGLDVEPDDEIAGAVG